MVYTMLEIDRKIYEKYVIYGRNKKTHIRLPQQGDVRDAEGITDVLHKYIKIYEVIWFRNKLIGSMRCKKLDKQRKTHRGMAHRRHESVAQK